MAVALTAAVLLGRTPPDGTTRWGQAPAEIRHLLWPEPVALPPFQLVDQTGSPFSHESLHGRWTLLFFGYLSCPDVCPTSLAALREMRRLLTTDPADTLPRFLFITVDPERDRPEALAPYLAAFDPAFIGLTGAPEEVNQLAAALAVKAVGGMDQSNPGLIDHTSSVMIIDPAGRVVGALQPPLLPADMARSWRQLRRYLRG